MSRRLWLTLTLAMFFLGGLANIIPVTGIEIGYYDIQSSPGTTSAVLPDNSEPESDPLPVDIIGISLPGTFSYSIVAQPQGQAGYVSPDPNSLTLFQLAEKYGSTGLLAHNFLAGNHFFIIAVGDRLVLEMSDGSSRDYQVTSILKYQAESPYSPYSEFINLSSGERVSASQLFNETYGSKDNLVLQTCIENNGVDAWGRLFIIAEPDLNLYSTSTENPFGNAKYAVAY